MKRVALVIDDDPSCANLARRFLERMDCAVFVAHSVAAARQAFKENRCHLLVTDVQLPDGDGVELAMELLRQAPELHVAIMSGNPENIDRARQSGLSRCILKPFDFDEFRNHIRIG